MNCSMKDGFWLEIGTPACLLFSVNNKMKDMSMCFHRSMVSTYTDRTYAARIVFYFTNEHLFLPETGNIILLGT